MADSIASLPPSGWLLLLFLAALIPLLVCLSLLLIAFVPSGAGRAGWRNPMRLPGREGIASWSALHPAFPALARRRYLVGVEHAPEVQPSRPRPAIRPAIAHIVTDLQRGARRLVRSPLLLPGRPSEDSA